VDLSACDNAQAGINPLRILALLKKNIPTEFLQEPIVQSSAKTFCPREVILFEYFACPLKIQRRRVS